MRRVTHHRTIWLSDIHLGSRDCRTELLLDFLGHNDCETLYLVGDIIDLERMRSRFYWPKSHTEVLRRILRKARGGTRVVYVPGNHDDDFRALAGTHLGPVEVARELIHTTARGKRMLVLHGDEFDSVLKCGPLASMVGAVGYGLLLTLNRINHKINELFGRPYWSLAQAVKSRIGKASRYVRAFEDACMSSARDADLDGVVCGHIHKAGVIERDGLVYCNDGDWVESCTALVESAAGDLAICRWAEVYSSVRRSLPVPLRDAA